MGRYTVCDDLELTDAFASGLDGAARESGFEHEYCRALSCELLDRRA
jgi:hypothetical protein